MTLRVILFIMCQSPVIQDARDQICSGSKTHSEPSYGSVIGEWKVQSFPGESQLSIVPYLEALLYLIQLNSIDFASAIIICWRADDAANVRWG
jgi:hypothetical protein